jgi:hypothetical protein
LENWNLFTYLQVIMKFLATISGLFLFLLSYGQNQQSNSQKDEIAKYYAEAVKGNDYALSSEVVNAITASGIIDISKPHMDNSDHFVRYKAIDLVRRKGMLIKDPVEKKMLTSWLLEACKDNDGGNSGVASRSLLSFSSGDFSSQAADSIMALISSHSFYLERLIRLSGFIHNESTLPFLSNVKQHDSTLTAKQKWAVDLALARLGNQESATYCINRITGTGTNDNTVAYLFPDLIYIRNKTAFNYLLQGILSDEKKCTSSNPDREKPVLCAFRIMELIAPYIESFPVQVTSYGELDIDNYDDALKKVREWILANDNYTIISEKY